MVAVTGPPLTPNVTLMVLNEGTVLNISWEEPYSPEGFPILSYYVRVENVTSNISLLQDRTTSTYYLFNSTDNAILYSKLNVTVRAESSVGSSNEAGQKTREYLGQT